MVKTEIPNEDLILSAADTIRVLRDIEKVIVAADNEGDEFEFALISGRCDSGNSVHEEAHMSTAIGSEVMRLVVSTLYNRLLSLGVSVND